MAYPSVHKFDVNHLTSYCASIGATPVPSYIRVPFRCLLAQVDAVTHGIITTADCSVAVAVSVAGGAFTAVSGSPFVIPVAGAAAGQVASLTPSSPTALNADDVIRFTPSGASGASIAATFGAALKPS